MQAGTRRTARSRNRLLSAVQTREPPTRVPYGKTVHRTILPTLLRFGFQKYFVICGSRQGLRPLTPRTFEKVRSKLLVAVRVCSVHFPLRRSVCTHAIPRRRCPSYGPGVRKVSGLQTVPAASGSWRGWPQKYARTAAFPQTTPRRSADSKAAPKAPPAAPLR